MDILKKASKRSSPDKVALQIIKNAPKHPKTKKYLKILNKFGSWLAPGNEVPTKEEIENATQILGEYSLRNQIPSSHLAGLNQGDAKHFLNTRRGTNDKDALNLARNIYTKSRKYHEFLNKNDPRLEAAKALILLGQKIFDHDRQDAAEAMLELSEQKIPTYYRNPRISPIFFCQ